MTHEPIPIHDLPGDEVPYTRLPRAHEANQGDVSNLAGRDHRLGNSPCAEWYADQTRRNPSSVKRGTTAPMSGSWRAMSRA